MKAISELEILVEKIQHLSVRELLTLQEQIIAALRFKTNSSESEMSLNAVINPARRVEGFYRPTVEEVEAELAEIFTAEELAEIANTDLSNLPQGTKSLSQMVNEDREDRV